MKQFEGDNVVNNGLRVIGSTVSKCSEPHHMHYVGYYKGGVHTKDDTRITDSMR